MSVFLFFMKYIGFWISAIIFCIFFYFVKSIISEYYLSKCYKKCGLLQLSFSKFLMVCFIILLSITINIVFLFLPLYSSVLSVVNLFCISGVEFIQDINLSLPLYESKVEEMYTSSLTSYSTMLAFFSTLLLFYATWKNYHLYGNNIMMLLFGIPVIYYGCRILPNAYNWLIIIMSIIAIPDSLKGLIVIDGWDQLMHRGERGRISEEDKMKLIGERLFFILAGTLLLIITAIVKHYNNDEPNFIVPEINKEIIQNNSNEKNLEDITPLENNNPESSLIANVGSDVATNQESVVDSVAFLKDGNVTIEGFTSDRAIANSKLKVSDYTLMRDDTIKLSITLNQPVKETGTYIIRYNVKEGWSIKHRYGVVELQDGDKNCTLILDDNREIASPEIYYRVNPSNILAVERQNYSESLIKSNNKKVIYRLKYADNSSCVVDEHSWTVNYDKPVTIEVYDKRHHWFERLYEDEYGNTDQIQAGIIIFIPLVLYLIMILCILCFNIDDKLNIQNLGLYVILGGAVLFVLFVLIALIVNLYDVASSCVDYLFLSI